MKRGNGRKDTSKRDDALRNLCERGRGQIRSGYLVLNFTQILSFRYFPHIDLKDLDLN